MTKNDKPHIHARSRKTSASKDLRNPLLSTDWKGPFEETAQTTSTTHGRPHPTNALHGSEELENWHIRPELFHQKLTKDNFDPKNMEKI